MRLAIFPGSVSMSMGCSRSVKEVLQTGMRRLGEMTLRSSSRLSPTPEEKGEIAHLILLLPEERLGGKDQYRSAVARDPAWVRVAISASTRGAYTLQFLRRRLPI